jgi:hypothetical protein
MRRSVSSALDGVSRAFLNSNSRQGAGTSLDKNSHRALAKISVGFDVTELRFNEANENYLAVHGLKACAAAHIVISGGRSFLGTLSLSLSLTGARSTPRWPP